MNKILSTSALVASCLFISMITSNAQAQELVRFDFQNYVAEGVTAFYRLDADLASLKGEFCFFDSASLAAGDKRLKILSEDIAWSTLFDLKEVPHACAKVDLYKPFGWFNTPAFTYEGADYRFVFIGKVQKERMEGKLYEFRDYYPKGKDRAIRTIDQVMVSVQKAVDKQK